jgi:hypothetical protein
MEVFESKGATLVQQCAVSHGFEEKFVQKLVQPRSAGRLPDHKSKY